MANMPRHLDEKSKSAATAALAQYPEGRVHHVHVKKMKPSDATIANRAQKKADEDKAKKQKGETGDQDAMKKYEDEKECEYHCVVVEDGAGTISDVVVDENGQPVEHLPRPEGSEPTPPQDAGDSKGSLDQQQGGTATGTDSQNQPQGTPAMGGDAGSNKGVGFEPHLQNKGELDEAAKADAQRKGDTEKTAANDPKTTSADPSLAAKSDDDDSKGGKKGSKK